MNNLDWDIMLPAFIAGALILTTHVPLGMRVLARGVIFVDLAIAQIAGLGVIIAGLMGLEDNVIAVQGMAVSSALLGAALLAYTEHKRPKIQEASIGLVFVLASTLGILLLSSDVHAGEHLKDLLAGQILWVSRGQLVATAILTAMLLVLWLVFRGRFPRFAFYGQFALAVTASVQLVGVYLVFTSLIVPALATYRCEKWRTATAYGIGLAGYAAGLLLSAWLDLPAGPAIVWAMALCGGAFILWKRL
jgi:zinc/manganese transport system permease protein